MSAPTGARAARLPRSYEPSVMSLDLFEPLVSESEMHPNFRSMLLQGNGYSCDVLNDWARGFVDRDGKFVKEFQTTYNSSFWELYLFAVLKKYGLAVDLSHARPDFCLPSHGFTIEAAVVGVTYKRPKSRLNLPIRPPEALKYALATDV